MGLPSPAPSYDEALQVLTESEAKRETAERELKIVSVPANIVCDHTDEDVLSQAR